MDFSTEQLYFVDKSCVLQEQVITYGFDENTLCHLIQKF